MSVIIKKITLALSFITGYSYAQEQKLNALAYVFQATTFAEKMQKMLLLLQDAKKCTSEFEVLSIALQNISIDGFYLEMGVFQGRTINFIASIMQNKIIYGFDSFQGLPEAWDRDDLKYFTKGFFATSGLPIVASNVELHKGWFNESLPEFKRDILRDQPIAFIHIDCDLYSSTKTIFDTLGDHIVDGTVIVFDELYNYQGFDRHEIKALYEFLQQKNLTLEYIAYNYNHQQVAIKIVTH